MLKRLSKLGIEKERPEDLTEEEVRRFARCDDATHAYHILAYVHA